MDKMLKVNDVADAMGCSLKKAYALVRQDDFPKLRVGREYYIPKDALQV